MNDTKQLIISCKDMVFDKKILTNEMINKLFNIDDKFLRDLSNAANEITRVFQGSKIDVEQLANIKKNYCSEDCTFCSQSAFFDTGIGKYQLMSPEDVVKQATDAKNAGAHSYCLVAAWREPSKNEFEQVCHIIEEVNEKVGISIECSLGFLTIQQAKKTKRIRSHQIQS